MSPTAIRRWIVRHRRQVTLTLALVALVGAVAAHHGGAVAAGAHHGDGLHAAVELCLGVFTAVGAGIAGVVLGLLALGRWRRPSWLAPGGTLLVAQRPLPRARAGPPLLALLCVSRR